MPDYSKFFVMSDLDGTLLNSNAEVSKENAEAIDRLVNNGGRFTFATGRSRWGVAHLLPSININTPAIINNGSLIWDFKNNVPIKSFNLDETLAASMLEAVMAAFPTCGVEIFCQDQMSVIAENDYVTRHVAYTKMDFMPETLATAPIPWVNACLLIDPALMEELKGFIKKNYGNAFFLQQSGRHFLEVQNPSANKGTAALELCRYIDHSVNGLFTVGDGPNDIELLSVTQMAFAPQNAHPDVLALNIKTLPANDDHTIAALIDRLSQF